MKSLLLSVCTVVAIISKCEGEADKLQTVIVLFRHGDRNIESSYQTDPYADESYWPGGYGQLTNKGKQQHFELGKWFRQRYQGFLPEKYSKDDIKVQSTDSDRTLMSVQAHLAGLYPPTEEQVWNPQLIWQPIPVHTMPKKQEVVLHLGKSCPKHHNLKEKLLNSDEFLRYQTKLADVYKYVSNHTGTTINTIAGLDELADTLFIEKLRGFELPEWTKTVYPEILNQWLGISRRISAYTPEMGRLKSGPLIYEIVNHFQKRAKGKKNKKYKIYSAHDSTIASLMTTLGVYNDLVPPYAASLIFELRQHKSKNYVNIWYKNDTIPLKITLPGCVFSCPLGDFVDLLKDVTIDLDEWEKECNDV